MASKAIIGLFDEAAERVTREYAADGFHLALDRTLVVGMAGRIFLAKPEGEWWHIEIVHLPDLGDDNPLPRSTVEDDYAAEDVDG
jgi:hypothetical protein